ncbi:zinc finger protein 865 [Denticeps clupeoides]|uniref:C2H2-type domain-containing protein n=1 Tax=Denticeps clupeoides TaxID=299321 RepID=A0AAY4A6A6_9TELE|nr:zinc finger protein 865-like [Denticeps clupeoides]
MFQFGKYNLDIIEMLSGHQAHQFKGLGLERQLQHQQQVQLHQHQLQQQQAETSGALLSGLGLGPLQGSRSNAFADSTSIFSKMSAPPPPLQQQSLSSSSHISRKSSKMPGSSSSAGSHVSGYPQFLRSFHPADAALAQDQLHPGVARFEHFVGASGSSGSTGGIGGIVSSVPPPPPPLHPGLSVPQASPGPSSSSPSPSSSVATTINPPSSGAVTTLGHQLVGTQSDARSLHQQFSCMLAANQYFLSGVPTNTSLEQFLVQQGGHNHLGLGSESGSGLAPPPGLHSSHPHSSPQQQSQPPQQQQLPPHTLSHPHSHPHHPLHSSSQPSSLSSFDFQGIPVLSSNQLATLMQQEAGLPLPLPLHLSLSKDDSKGDSGGGSGGTGGGRRKKAMAGYLPQRKSESNSNGSNSGGTSNPNPGSGSAGDLNQDSSSGLVGGGVSVIGGEPSSLLSSSSSVVSSSSSSAPSSTSASVLVTNGSHLSKAALSSMGPPASHPEPEPLYHCGECGKTFTHLSSLRRHLRSHELTTAGTSGTAGGVTSNPVQHPSDRSVPHSTQSAAATSSCPSPEKSFHCSDCGKGFKKKGHLLQHGVIHSGARPFACTICSRAFNRRESLTRHEKIHEEKPFRCPACGRCFRESTSLLNHAASGTCGKPGRPPRPRSPGTSNSMVGSKSNKSGVAGEGGIGISGVGPYRSDAYGEDFKDQRSQSSLYSGTSSCASGAALRKAPLAPTLHPHPQGQPPPPPHHQQPHLPLSSLLDDSEDDVTSSVNSAISAITAAAANCMSGDLGSGGGRGDDRRDIIGGLLGGLGLGPLGVSPSSTSGMEKSFRVGGNQGGMGGSLPQNPQAPGAKPKRPRKPRKKKEPGAGGTDVPKRRPPSQRGINGDERPYLCSVCGRGFARRETLRRHDRIHTGEKPHHCTICGKYFREAFHLSKHHTVHSGEKNYKCGLCGKDFGYAQSLKRHGKLHQKGEMEEVPTTPGGENLNSYTTNTGAISQDRGQGNSSSYYSYLQDVKPQGSTAQPPPPRLYTCAICWKSFRHHFHLTAHHQTVHETGGEKLFSCEVCGKAFAYSNSLTRHRLSQHGLTRAGPANPQTVSGGPGGSNSGVSESEAATNALLQLAPPGGGHGEPQPHSAGLHCHQQPAPQPQAGFSPLFYVPETNAPHPSSSNASPFSHHLPPSSGIPPLSHQQSLAGVKGEPIYQTSSLHSLNVNPPVHPLLGLPPPPSDQHQLLHHHHHHHHQQHHQHHHHLSELQPHHQHHVSFQAPEELRKKKRRKKKKESRERRAYKWDERVGREQMDLSGGGRPRDQRRKLLRKKRRAIRRRQRRFKRRMALLLRIRRGGGVVCELAAAGGLKLHSFSSLKTSTRRFSCSLCPRTAFSRRAALVVHRAAKHRPRARFPHERLRCPVCGKQSRRFVSAYIHRWSHLAKGSFSCKRCPSRFWSPALLKRHKTSCRGKPAGLRRARVLNLKLQTGSSDKTGDGQCEPFNIHMTYRH